MTKEKIEESLKHNFGFNSFRPMQEKIVKAVLKKQDCLVIMPTGGGKSLCYQLPATVFPGITIVVSPLIALMKDQVEGLVENGIKASYINSSLETNEIEDIMTDAKKGEIKMLYVSPEKLLSNSFQYFLHDLDISLFAIDEAHCISSWGHDFRKEYTQLGKLKQFFSKIPIIALTATADKITRKDIASQLNLKDPKIFLSSFDRPNLKLTVLPAQKRMQSIINFVKKRDGQSGIIYCLSRKQTEKVSSALQAENISADHYHAGMQAHERSRVQENFIYGKTNIIVATIAFGMGIDKSNVRFVIHHNLPKNIEGYYQEIGRAGRDGMPSETILFYTFSDVVLLKKFASESGQATLQLAKLERMQQYADALICRRRILLSYFGEHLDKDCQNCDVCENPPELIDGTKITRMALSAIFRLEEKVAVNTLIDVLRGSARQDIIIQGYDKIKTYGIGKDISPIDWKQYILQMLNMGFIDIAYDQNYSLKITEAGKKILLGKKEIKFVSLSSIKERELEKVEEKKSKKQVVEEELFENLRALRRSISKKFNIPPYIVFNDATLAEMSDRKPLSEEAMKSISGVGDKKYKSYGQIFIEEITKFIREKDTSGQKIEGTTQELTYSYYKQNIPINQIAEKRNLKPQTIYGHLAELYEQGYDIDILQFISKSDLKTIIEELKTNGIPKQIKTLYQKFNEKFEYHKLKLAIAHYQVNFEKGVIRYD